MASNPIPVVFVHGSGGNSTIWHHQVAYLTGKHRPLAVDLPGHGGAGGEPRPSVDYYADAVERFIAGQQAERPVLAGHSLGGAIIQTMALRNPAGYRGLVLVGTGARLRVLPALLEQLKSNPRAALDLMTSVEWAEGTDPSLKAELRREAEAVDPHVFWCDFTACDQFDVIGRLGGLSLPAIAIVGAEDRLTPRKYAEYFRQNLPHCRVEVIAGAGHMVQVEQPEAVNRALGKFLAELS